MSRKKKRIELNSDSIQNNPFVSLDVSFSEEELAASSRETEHSTSEKNDNFPGGVVKVRLEKKGRGGKSVTVFYGFEKEQGDSIREVLSGLKKALATGGKITEDGIELQGDLRAKAAEWFSNNGYKVKGQIS